MKEIIVNDIPKSPNGSDGLLRMHWAKRGNYNAKWKLLIRSQIRYIPERPPTLRQLVYIHQIRKRKMDPDNLVASCKPILDALVHCGLIKDDKSECIDLECTQDIGREPKTIIGIGRSGADNYQL